MTEDIDILIKWLKVREEFEEGFKLTTLYNLQDDISNSSLLERMLNGEEPLTDPPPLAFGQPWYDLVEDGVGTPCSVELMTDPNDPEKQVLLIDEAIWNIDEPIGNRAERRAGSTKAWWATYHTKVADKSMPKIRWRVINEGKKEGPLVDGKPTTIDRWSITKEVISITTPSYLTSSTSATYTTDSYTTTGNIIWSIQ